jgi:hypothetical protein
VVGGGIGKCSFTFPRKSRRDSFCHGATEVRLFACTQTDRSLSDTSADTALPLARYFGIEPEFWMNLQARHDLKQAEASLGRRLKTEVTNPRRRPAKQPT